MKMILTQGLILVTQMKSGVTLQCQKFLNMMNGEVCREEGWFMACDGVSKITCEEHEVQAFFNTN